MSLWLQSNPLLLIFSSNKVVNFDPSVFLSQVLTIIWKIWDSCKSLFDYVTVHLYYRIKAFRYKRILMEIFVNSIRYLLLISEINTGCVNYFYVFIYDTMGTSKTIGKRTTVCTSWTRCPKIMIHLNSYTQYLLLGYVHIYGLVIHSE